MGFLLYDLYLDIAWVFCPPNHKILHLAMAVLRVYMVFAVISISFPSLSRLLCALSFPSKPPIFWKHKLLTLLNFKNFACSKNIGLLFTVILNYPLQIEGY